MQKIVPFKKDIIFKTNLSEITSISLDHDLKIEDKSIKGDFILNGMYKMLDTSINTEDFNFDLPFSFTFEDSYILDKAKIDIDDFYYEIVDDNKLHVNIDVMVDEIEEKEIEEKDEKNDIEDQTDMINTITDIEEPRCVEEEDPPQKEEKQYSFFNIDEEEAYKNYTVYIVRENDTIEGIIKKFETTKEIVEQYNDLSEMKIGDKIIIPSA